MLNDSRNTDRPDDPIDWESLARYLAGESSAPEAARIQQWLAEHKADAELLTAIDNAMSGLALHDISDVDVESALMRVAARRDAPPSASDVSSRAPVRDISSARRSRFGWRVGGLVAAAAVIVLAARVVLDRNGSGGAPMSQPRSDRAQTFASRVGQLDSVRLSDGARVILGPASQLVVAAGYGQGSREVELHGEAYFDVVHDSTRPFVIRAADATIRDIGTSFAVRSDSGARVQVVVTSGSIALAPTSSSDRGAVLAAGDVGTLQADGHVAIRHDATTASYLAWMQDSLVFRDAPLGEVSSGLRRWYGVVLRVPDSSLAGRHLTMTFSHDSIENVLRVIGLGLGAEVERHGDTAIVRPSTRSTRTQ
jgi:transmembrane sensor